MGVSSRSSWPITTSAAGSTTVCPEDGAASAPPQTRSCICPESSSGESSTLWPERYSRRSVSEAHCVLDLRCVCVCLQKYEVELFKLALPCLSAVGGALPPDYMESKYTVVMEKQSSMDAEGNFNPQPADTSRSEFSCKHECSRSLHTASETYVFLILSYHKRRKSNLIRFVFMTGERFGLCAMIMKTVAIMSKIVLLNN